MLLRIKGNPINIKKHLVGRVTRNPDHLDENSFLLVDNYISELPRKNFMGILSKQDEYKVKDGENVVFKISTLDHLEEGDIVSVDCGVELNGYFGDAAFTFAFQDVPEPTMELLRVTYASLYKGLEQAVAGKRVGDISFAIQYYCEREHPYSVVRELVGHGVGRSLHEDPEVPNYGKRGKGPLMQSGLVLAVEPMINLGRKEVFQHEDGWTIHTRDRKPSAHFEHSVAVRKGKPDILSTHEYLLEEIKNNPELKEVLPKN